MIYQDPDYHDEWDGSMEKRGRFRSIIPTLIAALALFVSLLAWGFSSPVGSSPDEDYHLVSIWCSQGEREGLCEPGDAPDERRVPQRLLQAPCFAYDANVSGSCSTDLTMTLINSDRGNFGGDYPPLFYATMGLFASADVEASVLVMRSFNALLFVGFLVTLFLALPLRQRGALVWGVLATLIPLGAFLVPSINPSSWSVIAAATLWAAMYGYWKADSTRRRVMFGALATIAALMAAGSRADSAVYAGIAIVVTAIMFAPSPKASPRLWILPASLAVVAAAIFLSTGDAGIVAPVTEPDGAGEHGLLALIAINLIYIPSLVVGALGTWGLGWLDTAMPPGVWVTMIGIFAAVVFWGLGRMTRRSAVGVGLVALSIVVIPMYILVNEGLLVGAGVQPRYIYPLMVMLAGLVATGHSRLSLGLNRIQLVLIGIGVVVANALALNANARRYVTGVDNGGLNLDAGKDWWWDLPVSPMVMWFVGTCAFAVAVGIFILAAFPSSTPLPIRDDAESDGDVPSIDATHDAAPAEQAPSKGARQATVDGNDRGALPNTSLDQGR